MVEWEDEIVSALRVCKAHVADLTAAWDRGTLKDSSDDASLARSRNNDIRKLLTKLLAKIDAAHKKGTPKPRAKRRP